MFSLLGNRPTFGERESGLIYHPGPVRAGKILTIATNANTSAPDWNLYASLVLFFHVANLETRVYTSGNKSNAL